MIKAFSPCPFSQFSVESSLHSAYLDTVFCLASSVGTTMNLVWYLAVPLSCLSVISIIIQLLIPDKRRTYCSLLLEHHSMEWWNELILGITLFTTRPTVSEDIHMTLWSFFSSIVFVKICENNLARNNVKEIKILS